jgi:hypothetical protein
MSATDNIFFSPSELEEIRAEWTRQSEPAARDSRDEMPKAKVNLSLDLSEATYNIPFEIIEANEGFFDSILSDFAPWLVFRELFAIKKRKVVMTDLIEQGFWDGDEILFSSNGTFMGDPLSFLHLTVYLRTLCYATFGPRYKPIGQAVGDDLILMAISQKHAELFNMLVVRTGGETSKFNSISPHAMTFCEQYAYAPSDAGSHDGYAKGSRFGDLFFLDTIKGSILSGKSKVTASKQSPFFGHSRMLNKQLEWHPISWVRERAPKLIWASNYNEAIKLGSATATLPDILGGFDLSLGKRMDESVYEYRVLYKPYLEKILTLEEVPFLTFVTLLLGIYKSNPKGVPYENSFGLLQELLPELEVTRVRDINSLLPSWMGTRPIGERIRFVGKVLNLGTVDHLVEELARREAFKLLWDQKSNPKQYMTLGVSDVRKRHHEVWTEIRRSLEPVPLSRHKSSNPEDLAKRLRTRLWGYYYSKEDGALKDVFGGMTTLYMNF